MRCRSGQSATTAWRPSVAGRRWRRSRRSTETSPACWIRAQAYFTSCGITVERVLTDNGSCYEPRAWHDTLTAAGITHKRTRPYRPPDQWKVERLNRARLAEWAYAHPYRSEAERRDAFPQGLHTHTRASPQPACLSPQPGEPSRSEHQERRAAVPAGARKRPGVPACAQARVRGRRGAACTGTAGSPCSTVLHVAELDGGLRCWCASRRTAVNSRRVPAAGRGSVP
ncbi:DDE-type integrase/transposase/recombinase [Streptomyces sp. NPDC014872]|uniref:DDE-type integrase/transposase/recombinase n=1 Tax=unclassified Streptomyces TaxID=2593676 RepID=UPI0036F70468